MKPVARGAIALRGRWPCSGLTIASQAPNAKRLVMLMDDLTKRRQLSELEEGLVRTRAKVEALVAKAGAARADATPPFVTRRRAECLGEQAEAAFDMGLDEMLAALDVMIAEIRGGNDTA